MVNVVQCEAQAGGAPRSPSRLETPPAVGSASAFHDNNNFFPVDFTQLTADHQHTFSYAEPVDEFHRNAYLAQDLWDIIPTIGDNSETDASGSGRQSDSPNPSGSDSGSGCDDVYSCWSSSISAATSPATVQSASSPYTPQSTLSPADLTSVHDPIYLPCDGSSLVACGRSSRSSSNSPTQQQQPFKAPAAAAAQPQPPKKRQRIFKIQQPQQPPGGAAAVKRDWSVACGEHQQLTATVADVKPLMLVLPTNTQNSVLSVIPSRPASHAPTTFVRATPSVTPGKIVVSSAPRRSSQSDVEVHQRATLKKIKNRESAQLSRLRQKEYLATLESHVAELEAENDKLRARNAQLEQTVKLGQCNSCGRRQPDSHSQSQSQSQMGRLATGGTLLLCMFALVFAVNTGTSFYGAKSPPATLDSPAELSLAVPNMPLNEYAFGHDAKLAGRTLMAAESPAADSNGTAEEQLEWQAVQRLHLAELEQAAGNASLPHANCDKSALNRTERIRLNDALSDWVERHAVRLPLHQINESDKARPVAASRHGRRPSKVDKKKEGKRINNKRILDSLSDLQLPTPMPPSVERYLSTLAAMQAIHDSYYLLSFHDYFVVPGNTSDHSRRPRVSLVVPSLLAGNNGTNVSMMRIECEVTNMQQLQLPGELVQQMRAQASGVRLSGTRRPSRTQQPA